MTREEAVQTLMKSGSRVLDRLRMARPQWECDVLERECAEDGVDGLVALGLLQLDADPSHHTTKEA